ncbi:vitamin B12 dependent-methionine synthase activation domain-containing protein [Bacteroides sp.]|uniref:vitamin B12 dependent-methionine synthase activation domain-containing protein n=1 Tax=Bacteroides sp. TaxID=29523 RepID=UPI002623B531|nr:vitamin B12 dependent-methionine synthase activation domain-containing protein [Bacteroides sp.]
MLEERQVELQSLALSEADIYLAMGYRGYKPDENICALVTEVYAEIQSLCKPRYMFQMLEAELIARKRVRVGDVEFSPGGIIGSYLPGLTQICLFVATAGKEYDVYLHQLKAQDNIVKEYVADSIGSVIAESCVTLLGKELDTEGEQRHSLPYSPGYCGWDIREQQKLFSLFPSQPCGIALSDSFLMSPVKSVSGFFGLGKELHPQPYRCEICTNIHCYKRKQSS